MQDKLQNLNFGIIGIGEHALKVINSFGNTSKASLSALGTSSEEKAILLKSKFPYLEIFSSYEELLSDQRLKAIYITLPNHLHFLYAKKALEAKKHVLCEKPLCLKFQEAQTLAALAQANSCLLIEGFMYRFHPQHQKVKSILAEGIIGQPRLLEVNYHYQLQDPKNIRLQKNCFGGALTDVGCYLIDLCLFLFKEEPRKITATSNFDPELKIDLSTQIDLDFSNELRANLSASMEKPRSNSYTIIGSAGSLKVRNAFHVEAGQTTYIDLKNSEGKTSTLKIEPFNQLAAQLDAFSLQTKNPLAAHPVFNDYVLNAKIMEALINM